MERTRSREKRRAEQHGAAFDIAPFLGLELEVVFEVDEKGNDVSMTGEVSDLLFELDGILGRRWVRRNGWVLG